MVGLDYVSDQKHLTAVNSMTVVSMIYFCDITKAVKLFWQVDDLLQFQKRILRKIHGGINVQNHKRDFLRKLAVPHSAL